MGDSPVILIELLGGVTVKTIRVCMTPTCTKCKEIHRILDEHPEITNVDYQDLTDGSVLSLSIIKEYNLKQVPFLMFFDEQDCLYDTHQGEITYDEICKKLNVI